MLDLAEADGDLVVLAEPDGTFLAKDIIKLLAYSEEVDAVLGTRTTNELIWEGANMGAFLPRPPKGRTLVLGAGKAGGSMAQALEALWPAASGKAAASMCGHLQLRCSK